MDGITLYALNRSIDQCLPLRVQKIYHPKEKELVFGLWSPEMRKDLVISLEKNVPFFGLVNESRDMPKTPSGICFRLRKRLEGGVLQKVHQEGLDRVVYFEFSGHDDFGNLCTYTLVLDGAGTGGGFGLLNEGIVEFHFPETSARFQTGCAYCPPKSEKRNLLSGSALCEVQDLYCSGEPAVNWIMSKFEGVGKDLALSLIAGLGLRKDDALDPACFELILESLRGLRYALLEEQFHPAIYLRNSGEPVFSVFPLHHLDCVSAFDSVLEGISAYRDYAIYFEEYKRLERETRAIWKKVQDKVLSRYLSQQKDLEQATEFEKFRVWAELIDSAPQSLPAGHDSIEVLDYYKTPPERVFVPLDPRFSAKENARRYYKKYAKLKRANKILSDSLAESRILLERLQQIEKSLNEEHDLDSLNDLCEQAVQVAREAGIGMRKVTDKRNRRPAKVSSSSGPRGSVEILSSGEGTLYIGKNAQGNDYIVRRIKRPGDIWFHAKNLRGAHVLLRTPYRGDVTPETLLWAARIAAQRSDGNLAGKVEVDYTDATNVKKPGGSPPGFVTYKGAKTIIVEI